uniref:Uncharacterized protein n=1 Tax=Emiliania huxleyi TaxID=2903 RepID=A0A7S3WFW9_EMIHU
MPCAAARCSRVVRCQRGWKRGTRRLRAVGDIQRRISCRRLAARMRAQVAAIEERDAAAASAASLAAAGSAGRGSCPPTPCSEPPPPPPPPAPKPPPPAAAKVASPPTGEPSADELRAMLKKYKK